MPRINLLGSTGRQEAISDKFQTVLSGHCCWDNVCGLFLGHEFIEGLVIGILSKREDMSPNHDFSGVLREPQIVLR